MEVRSIFVKIWRFLLKRPIYGKGSPESSRRRLWKGCYNERICGWRGNGGSSGRDTCRGLWPELRCGSCFRVHGKEGTQLNCRPSEILNDGNGAKSRGMDGPEGSCHRLNLRTPDTGMLLDYTFADHKDYTTYRPLRTFYGYRFVSITADQEVRIRSIQSIPVSSITQQMETGSITTGNKLVNQLISNTLWGQRSNYLSVPTDCPQRNERLGWTADTQVFAETGTFFANTADFFHKWMRDMRDTQSPTGAYPGVAPLAQYGASPTDMNRLGWSDSGSYRALGCLETIW